MSRTHLFHPVPRGGIDPIRSRHDALAVLALGAPYGHDTIAVLLDTNRCGRSVLVVANTDDTDALHRIIDVCIQVTNQRSEISGILLATSRPDGDVEPADVDRWYEASKQCHTGGLELLEWFVLGRSGPRCPRELCGDPERWAA
jgi:hypothetical protein